MMPITKEQQNTYITDEQKDNLVKKEISLIEEFCKAHNQPAHDEEGLTLCFAHTIGNHDLYSQMFFEGLDWETSQGTIDAYAHWRKVNGSHPLYYPSYQNCYGDHVPLLREEMFDPSGALERHRNSNQRQLSRFRLHFVKR